MRLELTIFGDPRTKKNSPQIFQNGSRPFISPSEAFKRYREEFIYQVPKTARNGISGPVNACCVYYMATRRKVDLLNLLEASMDLLVEAGVLADDNSRIVAGHDGSRVRYDKNNPRVEIVIEDMAEDE